MTPATPAVDATALGAYLRALRDERASDLHLHPGAAPHLRVRGRLRPLSTPALSPGEVRGLLGQVLTSAHWARFNATGAVDVAWSHAPIGRFRVSVWEAERGTTATFRLIPEILPDTSELEIPVAVQALA